MPQILRNIYQNFLSHNCSLKKFIVKQPTTCQSSRKKYIEESGSEVKCHVLQVYHICKACELWDLHEPDLEFEKWDVNQNFNTFV